MTSDLKLFVTSINPQDSDVSTTKNITLIENSGYSTLFSRQEWGEYNEPTVLVAGRENGSGEVYYSWYTACMGTGYLNAGTNFICPDTICPSGWTIPTNEDMTKLSNYDTSWTNSLGLNNRSQHYSFRVTKSNASPSWGQVDNEGTKNYIWLKNGGTSSASSHILQTNFPNPTHAWSSDSASVGCLLK